MVAIDPRSGAPGVWSLKPEDTLGLVFWTKDPSLLIASQLRLDPYHVTVNVTATGWGEVEKGAPTLYESGELLLETAEAFQHVYWRFSPIPALPKFTVLERFCTLLAYAHKAKLTEVFVSFLQPNDRIPEVRTPQERFELLNQMSGMAAQYGIEVKLCRDDRSFADWQGAKFSAGICVPQSDFPGATRPEDCGCTLMVDPFTINESCQFGCQYCYAADQGLASKKNNSTRRLKVVTP